jgi:hypothetical protein
MSSELAIYKQNRIAQLNATFRTNLERLNINLSNNIRVVQNSRIRNKTIIINHLIVSYRNTLSNLINSLNSSIKIINLYKPEFNVIKTNNKKAILIGINYLNTPYELSGCINDTHKINTLLTNYGFTSINLLTDLTINKPTKQNILNELKNMLINSSTGDILFFYFSGHGSYTYDMKNDETDGRDEMIIRCDIQGVLDDDIKYILKTYMKKDVTLIGLFDSCHSGTMFDLKYCYLDSNNYDKYSENDKVSECNGNVIMISGCMDSQTSTESLIDNKVQGAMTWSFIEAINNTPNLSWRELLTNMRTSLKNSSFTQIPQLSTDSFYDIDSKLFI